MLVILDINHWSNFFAARFQSGNKAPKLDE